MAKKNGQTKEQAPLCAWCGENPRREYEKRDGSGTWYGTLCEPCEPLWREARRELKSAVVEQEADPLWELPKMPKSQAYRLYHHGVSRIAHVAALTPAQVREFVGPQASDDRIETWLEQAKEEAGETDDLTAIKGIGKATAHALRESGILTYEDLANAEPHDGIKEEWQEAAKEMA